MCARCAEGLTDIRRMVIPAASSPPTGAFDLRAGEGVSRVRAPDGVTVFAGVDVVADLRRDRAPFSAWGQGVRGLRTSWRPRKHALRPRRTRRSRCSYTPDPGRRIARRRIPARLRPRYGRSPVGPGFPQPAAVGGSAVRPAQGPGRNPTRRDAWVRPLRGWRRDRRHAECCRAGRGLRGRARTRGPRR